MIKSSNAYLLKFQIGPVQDFIAQARSTRDLWSGSYLLSWLVASGIRALRLHPNSELIFPVAVGQPLLAEPFDASNSKALLTPNLPNIFIASVSGDAKKIAEDVEAAVIKEWTAIASAVWNERFKLGLPDCEEDQFFAQVKKHLSVSWMITPVSGDNAEAYAHDYQRNGWQLDAVRQTRDFKAWSFGGWQTGFEKDSLSGREEAVAGGRDIQNRVNPLYQHLFKHEDHLGAVNLIKRVWHRVYLEHQPGLAAAVVSFKILSTRGIAARDSSADADENMEAVGGEKYLAAIAFDGDSIGAWVSGEKLPGGSDLRQHHKQFSACLSEFALNLVRSIVELDHEGFLIYAGGDDVVALVPADHALSCANALREAFQTATHTISGRNGLTPDASAGIAISHFKSPLQDLVRAAQAAEKHAKNTIGRPAFSVTLMKRSGEIDVWGAKWIGGGLELHEAIVKAMTEMRLSAKFPHRVCALLSPYLTSSIQEDASDFNAHDVIHREFAHATDRQKIGTGAPELATSLDDYLRSLGTEPQACLDAIFGLCKSVAFTYRNHPSSDPAERQHAP